LGLGAINPRSADPARIGAERPRITGALAAGLIGAGAVAWWFGEVGPTVALTGGGVLLLWLRGPLPPADPLNILAVTAVLAGAAAVAWWFGAVIPTLAFVLAALLILWMRWPVAPEQPRSVVVFVAVLGGAAAVAWWFGAVAATLALAGIAALALALRLPIALTALTFVLAGAFGGFGGHLSIPGAGLPVFELLLVAGAGGAVAWLRLRWDQRSRTGTAVALIWLPAALYALLLLAFFNQRDFVAGAREAIILGYPLLVALPFATVDPGRLRRFLERRGVHVLALIVGIAALLGVINLAIGNTVDTSSGQPRSLPGEFSAALGAGLLVAVWLAMHRGRYLVAIPLAAVSSVGLLLVNHRSSYVALIVGLAVLGLATGALRALRANPRRGVLGIAAVSIASALLLVFTPLGRNGVERFGALFDRDDNSYEFREDALATALKKDDVGQVVFGTGVGLQPTNLDAGFSYDLSEASLSVQRIEAHNSFATIYQRAGVIGLLLILAPITMLVRRMIRRHRDGVVAVCLSVFAFMTVMALFNVVLENLYFGIWFWFPLLIGGVLASRPEDELDDRPG
jgi:hypothetical protein